jgi:hypothetical protein
MPLIEGEYRAPLWLPGAHSQTIVPARLLPAPAVRYRRERWDTPDGDFIDVDHAQPEPAAAGAPLLVLFHGLEGDSRSHYARALMRAAADRGWRALVAHFRGCGGELNRLPRAYHSGDSDEIDWILRRAHAAWPQARLHAVGVSLGGNALAKWLGERGADAAWLHAGASISAPFDLVAGGRSLERGANRIYALVFLVTMRRKAVAMVRRFPGLADERRIVASRTLYEFDDAFTAPVHGFRGALDYWERASAKPWLRSIAVPMLALNALNDPFQPAPSLPRPSEVSAQVLLEQPRHGGHVGFAQAPFPGDLGFLPRRVMEFFEGVRG